MSDIGTATYDNSRYSTPEEWSRSTSYSEFCDDDVILSADPIQPRDATSRDRFAAECSSSVAPTSSTSTAIGKRKFPDDSVLSDRPSASYKKRTISTGSPIDIDALAPLESSSGTTLRATTPPLSNATLTGPVEDGHHLHDAVGPEPFIIAHNTSVKQAMDARGLPWGVQWEIARLISLGHCSWDDISMSALDVLRTEGLAPPDPDSPPSTPAAVLNARIGPYIEDLFRWNRHTFGSQRPSKEILATAPWQELDKEDLAFTLHGPTGCLGSAPEPGGFYGGTVSFCMRAQLKEGAVHVALERPARGHSSRFTRCYGSSWMVKLRLPVEALSKPGVLEKMRSLLIRPFVLNGRVFRFFHLNKSHAAYLMATNEWYKGGGLLQSSPGIYCSFLDFFKKHNDLEQNHKQTMAKWAARTALGLSNSVPGIMLDSNQIRGEVDIVSSSCPAGAKPTSEMVMTDGCGLINLQAMHMVHEKLGLWKEAPSAIQCRLAGAKGLLLLHPNKEENSWDYPCVWLRPSQIKIQHTGNYLQNPAHRVIDTLRASHMRSSIQVSKEIIVNLSENGVSPNIFVDLFSQSIENTISPLLTWDGQDAMPQLWAAVARVGNVMAARTAQESSWTARARGITGVQLPYDQDESTEDYEEEDDDSLSHSVAWWGDDISGCPSSLEETAMTFLDNGFHPTTNAILAEKLHIIAKKTVKSCTSKSRVTIPMSCSALIVPDPLGVLEDREVHIKCSQRCLLRPDGQKSDRVVGDVLVTRNPCKLPTDTQRVKAVFRPELDDYVNVIVFSIKGSRSLASMLGTGDYDGDRVDCIWQPSIVEAFTNADPKYMDPPTCLWDNFVIKNETVEEFLQRVPPNSPIDHQTKELQAILMAPLCDLHVVGTYSTMHDNAIYTLGYSHPTTTLLAWIFCTVLDGAKTGKTILPARYKQDRDSKQYGTQFVPQWKNHDICFSQYDLPREHLPPFVMDLLKEATDRVRDEQLRRIAEHFAALPEVKVKDKDLVAPWQGAEARAEELLSRPEEHVRAIGQAQKDGLEAIKVHVVRVCDLYFNMLKMPPAETHASPSTAFGAGMGSGVVGSPRRKGSGGGGGGGTVSGVSGTVATFTTRSIETRQDQLRRMSREFAGGPSAAETFAFSREEVARLRASYAYLYDWTRRPLNGGSRFPWSVAMRDLGDIKLRACKDFRPISQDFYEKMTMRKL